MKPLNKTPCRKHTGIGVIASGKVRRPVHEFKMLRIHAATITTQMIHFHPNWDVTNECGIREAMRTNPPPIDLKRRIAVIPGPGVPEPAARILLLNKTHETIHMRKHFSLSQSTAHTHASPPIGARPRPQP